MPGQPPPNIQKRLAGYIAITWINVHYSIPHNISVNIPMKIFIDPIMYMFTIVVNPFIFHSGHPTNQLLLFILYIPVYHPYILTIGIYNQSSTNWKACICHGQNIQNHRFHAILMVYVCIYLYILNHKHKESIKWIISHWYYYTSGYKSRYPRFYRYFEGTSLNLGRVSPWWYLWESSQLHPSSSIQNK